MVCQRLSWYLICRFCLNNLEKNQTNSKRTLDSGLKVYSFFKYSDIDFLLHSKHKLFGSEIFELLSKITFSNFSKNFIFPTKIYAIGIDDNIKDGYSHTAILTNALKTKNIEPIFGALRAKSKLTYSGKSLSFRKANPRQFELKNQTIQNVILVDDLITTGTTLQEAHKIFIKFKINVLFALTLANAQDK